MPPTTTGTRVTGEKESAADKIGRTSRANVKAAADYYGPKIKDAAAGLARGAVGMVLDNPVVKGAAAAVGKGDPGAPLGKAYVAASKKQMPPDPDGKD